MRAIRASGSILSLSLFILAGCAAHQDARSLVGVANFRDVGGYRTADGHIMRSGLLYRSAQLSTATPSDQRKLAELGVRYEIDLRSEQERTEQPSRWGANAPKVLTPFRYPEDGQPQSSSATSVAAMTSKFMSPTTTAEELNEMTKKFYASMIIDRAQEMGEVLRDLASEDAPALIHCTGGKDRTGQTVAVLMTVLGVPRDQVYEEYLKSNLSVAVWYEDMTAKMKAAKQPYLSFELFKARSGANSAWLDGAFASIDNHYGSFGQYVRDGLKLSPEDVGRLKTRYLRE
jgi:protein-tyrosine phosphatase